MKEFELAITKHDILNRLYERLKDRRLPAPDVMLDEVAQLGLPLDDRRLCADVFLDNIRYLELIKVISGVERLISIEQVLEHLPEPERRGDDKQEELQPPVMQSSITQMPLTTRNEPNETWPSVHIDVQIHIDSSASSEQIDQIFASMAYHLYGRKQEE